jgi:hypothetical protein
VGIAAVEPCDCCESFAASADAADLVSPRDTSDVVSCESSCDTSRLPSTARPRLAA